MEKLYTVDELAEYLSLKPRTIRKKLRDGEIIGIKISGKEWRITSQAVKEYLTKT